MATIKAGDVVQLKSGGPAMTVEAIEGTECVCLWFGGNGSELQRRHIKPHVLSLVPEDALQTIGQAASQTAPSVAGKPRR